MDFAEAWPEIQAFLLETVRAETGVEAVNPPVGGTNTFEELERKLSRELPEEFRLYLRHRPLLRGDYVPFHQSFELFTPNGINPEKSGEWGDFPEAEGIVSAPLVVGQDTAIAFVTDLDDESCPVFRIDEVYEWIPKLMAPSLAGFLYLLSYREMLYQLDLARYRDDGQSDTAGGEKTDEMLAEKIETVAPGCLQAWN